MAENEDNNTEAAAAPAAQAPEGPQFALQRIYLKDSSFESPRSPAVFQGKWAPTINFDIKTRNEKVQDDIYEVVLVLTVEAKLEEQAAFLVEVHQAGIFACKEFDEAQLEQLLATVCPNILFAYAREAVDSMVVKGSFPALMLSPINFDALYAQQKQAMAEQAANGNGADSAESETPPVTN
ncbi:MAG: protein-export chaperone SecB [SAR86 cluster bacterium]|uniref:Protein-export protein SecB n=1 Tax=SAR86 cluster bacterium TaxID=2030880 RepID=A0A2A5ASZ2_9GAMM|nr:MAG: protein-export chaperone SecB [SAR86 cluster bacterium]